MTDGKHAEWVEARSSFDVWKFGRFTFEVGQYGDSGNYKGVIRHSVWRTVSMIAPCSLTLEEFILFCEETARTLDRILRAQVSAANENGTKPRVKRGPSEATGLA